MTHATPPWDAYRATTYRVQTPRGELAIRIGQILPELDALLADHAVRTWAFITACNPRSEQWSVEENQQRMTVLWAELERSRHIFFPGAGVSDTGDWPAEASVLVLGMTAEAARALGRWFEQAAVVCGERGGPAELVACD